MIIIKNSNLKNIKSFNIDLILNQHQKLYQDIPINYAFFGNSIDLSNDFLVVGAYNDSTGLENSGTVYYFKLVNGDYIYQNNIISTTSVIGEKFGDVISITPDNNFLFISSINSNISGYNNSGIVHVYKNINDVFIFHEILLPPVYYSGCNFGKHIKCTNNFLYISEPSSSINGTNKGVIHIYKYNGNNFILNHTIQPLDVDNNNNFPSSINVSENGLYLIAGNSRKTNSFNNNGTAYLFEQDINEEYQLINTFLPSDGKNLNNFGKSVDISNDGKTVSISSNDGIFSYGAVYIFEYNTLWNEIKKIILPNRLNNGLFGTIHILSSDGNYLISTSYTDDTRRGLVNLYSKNTKWNYQYTYIRNDVLPFTNFGIQIALRNNILVIGSDDDTFSFNHGAVYIFK